MASFDFTIFCLTVIALVAIVHRKDEIAIKSLAVMARVVGLLGDTTRRIKRHFKKSREHDQAKNPSEDEGGVPEVKNRPRANRRDKRRS